MKKELNILLLAAAFSTFVNNMLGPIYAIFVEKIEGGILEASYAIAIFSISAGILIYIISKWEDRLKYKEKLLPVGYLLSSVGFFSYMFVSKPVHLYIVEVIFGFAIAVLSPLYDGLYSKNIDKNKYVSEWGAWESMSYIISSLAALAGGFLVSYFGFEALFFTMFTLSLISVFVSLALVKETRLKLAKTNRNLSNYKIKNKTKIKNFP